MELIRQRVRLEFNYDVHFTRGVFQLGNSVLRDMVASAGPGERRTLFVVDSGTCTTERRLPEQIEAYCRANRDVIANVCSPLVLPGGESIKNSDAYVDQTRQLIHRHGICRHSFVVAVGGGALLDAVGYAAATAHRGVRLIRLPSTVLSQNDSGVGVKNSLNLFGKKNFLGTFATPFGVINDFDFLGSLTDRDWRSGMAEAIKVALIKDSRFFSYLEQHAKAISRRDPAPMEQSIYRCAELHLGHIRGGDPFETGSSRPLDFGHWAAHKLEQLTHHQLRHGEAVAIGIALDSTYSHLTGLLSDSEWRRIIDLLMNLGFSLYLPELESHDKESGALLAGLTEFQEHLGGRLTVMLLEGIGSGLEVHHLDRDVIAKSIEVLREYERVSTVSNGACMAAGRR
jgi:3-dehydroquinate synthase